ncbi:hypothetical protein EJ02DRAFT_457031 [Clathrospora elynae]|uniref:Uncharacterized protein n=1 Tax=Clathrospora elynae TaxID=706981 RepID=A0A6A5SI34_9PLEO|nr:hypothetical protein EJ02DRAFT_457031 [Clathrospora elynae]
MSGTTSSASPTTPAPAPSMLPQQTWATGLGETEQSDALQLSSVPWLDMFDSAMLDSACDRNHELDFSGADSGSGSGGTTYDHDASVGGRINTITPTSQGTTTVDHPFLSGQEEFGFSPRFDMSGEQSTSGFDKDCASVRMNIQQPSAGERSQTTSLDSLNRPAASINPSTSASSRSHSTTSANSLNKSTADQKDVCTQELNELSAALMKDLHSVVGCKLASSFLFTRSDKGSVEYLFKTLDGSPSQESAIGRMLQGSENFLEIMQRFNEPAQYTPSFLDLSLRGDALDFSLLTEAFDNSENNTEAQLDMRWRKLQSYLERRNAAPNALSLGSWLGDSFTFGLARKPDITSKVAVLACYTCLLWIYETVFFVIYHTLECSPSLAPAIKLPQTVPGLEINGFMLQNHPSLQIRILIQVSTYMLDSIEKALKGMLSDSTFQALLKTVLQQEGLQYSPGNETGMISVRCLIEKVNKMLD